MAADRGDVGAFPSLPLKDGLAFAPPPSDRSSMAGPAEGSASPQQHRPLLSNSQESSPTTSQDYVTYGLLSPTVDIRMPLDEALLEASRQESGAIGPSLATRLLRMWRRLLLFTGPGWLMSIAYVDPGNLEADLQCGAQFGYKLLWALLGSTVMGLSMQLVAARLGCATGKHLAEHCHDNYAHPARCMLWAFTELAIVGSDIQEVIGCSIGLRLLFGTPMPIGVLLTAAAAFCFLFLEKLGVRTLERFFGILILVLALSMGGLFAAIKPDREAMLEGLFVPSLPDRSAMQQVVGMVGCVVMPHNLFLHSALVQSRVIRPGEEAEAVFLFTVESSMAICTSLAINMSVLAVFAKGFFGTEASADVGLANAGWYLGQMYGQPLRVIWALGLVAAGQSSTMTGAYAGQWVMQGYLKLQVEPWIRAIITRSLALVPTLGVAIYFGGGHEGLDALNGYLNVLQSMVLPFAVIPLLTFAGARSIMGMLVLNKGVLCGLWGATGLVMVANMYLFFEKFGPWLSPAGLALGIGLYSAALLYVAWAPASGGKRPR